MTFLKRLWYTLAYFTTSPPWVCIFNSTKIRTLWTQKNPNPNQPWNDHHLIPWFHPQVVTIHPKKNPPPPKKIPVKLPGESSFQAIQGFQGYWCYGAGRHALDRLRQLEVRRPRRRARRRRTGDAPAAAAASHAHAQRVAGGGVRWVSWGFFIA